MLVYWETRVEFISTLSFPQLKVVVSSSNQTPLILPILFCHLEKSILTFYPKNSIKTSHAILLVMVKILLHHIYMKAWTTTACIFNYIICLSALYWLFELFVIADGIYWKLQWVLWICNWCRCCCLSDAGQWYDSWTLPWGCYHWRRCILYSPL